VLWRRQGDDGGLIAPSKSNILEAFDKLSAHMGPIPNPLPELSWARADVMKSLDLLKEWVESQISQQADWYRTHATRSAWVPRALNVAAVGLLMASTVFSIIAVAIAPGLEGREWTVLSSIGVAIGTLGLNQYLDFGFRCEKSWRPELPLS
jgi:hypothetical protein